MADIKGNVLEINLGSKLTAAYLYGFSVNGTVLTTNHKRWLAATLIAPATTTARVYSDVTGTDPKGVWQIWLCGTTSRTGIQRSNLDLSRKRANAVVEYLSSELKPVVYNIDRSWIGESLAVLKGRKDEVEYPLDRAVIIAFRRLAVAEKNPPPPPPVVRPSQGYSVPCCYWQQEFDYLNAVLDAWMADMGSGSFNDKGDARTAQPNRSVFIARLTGKGWSYNRAFELYETGGPYTRVNLEHAMGTAAEIRKEIERWKKLKGNCSPDDSAGLCKTAYLRYK